MLPRSRRVVVAVIGAMVAGLLASGCGAAPDNDVVARVDDAELDRDQFSQLVDAARAASGTPTDSLPDSEAARVDGPTARGIAGQFVAMELFRSDLDALGIEVPPIDSSLTGLERFQAEYQAVLDTWIATPTEVIVDDEVRAFYEQGPSSSGLVCVQHILVETEAEADEVVGRLESGEEFADVAAEVSIDPGSAAQGGTLGGCLPVAEFEQTYVPEFVEGSLAAEVGVPTAPVESEFGYHVIRIVPFDDLSPNDHLSTRFLALSEWHDIETDPEIGVWDVSEVVPLG